MCNVYVCVCVLYTMPFGIQALRNLESVIDIGRNLLKTKHHMFNISRKILGHRNLTVEKKLQQITNQVTTPG